MVCDGIVFQYNEKEQDREMTIRQALTELQSYQLGRKEETYVQGVDTRTLLVVTLVYLLCLLSQPLVNPAGLIWWAVYPIVMAPLTGSSYSKLLLKSLYILPIIILIGAFNPVYDSEIVFNVGDIGISRGWLTFAGLIIRGLLAFQALILLIRTSGFMDICAGLQRMGVPKVLTTQLMMLYRFSSVLMEEGLNMHRATISRGYGKKSFPLHLWTRIVGMLLLRTYDRSKRLHQSMISRLYDGEIHYERKDALGRGDIIFCGVWVIVFTMLYFIDFTQLILHAA